MLRISDALWRRSRNECFVADPKYIPFEVKMDMPRTVGTQCPRLHWYLFDSNRDTYKKEISQRTLIAVWTAIDHQPILLSSDYARLSYLSGDTAIWFMSMRHYYSIKFNIDFYFFIIEFIYLSYNLLSAWTFGRGSAIVRGIDKYNHKTITYRSVLINFFFVYARISWHKVSSIPLAMIHCSLVRINKST